MSKVTYITVTDFFPFLDVTENYTFPVSNVTSSVEMIQFNPTTARTNVALRGPDGKFISYKNKNVEKVYRVAVENLLPFPKGV